MTPRRDYRRDESAVRGAWYASVGACVEVEIRERAHCSPAVALRVYLLRRGGTMPVLDLWLEGALTLRQAERVILTAPFDEGAQLDEARATSPLARARASRPP